VASDHGIKSVAINHPPQPHAVRRSTLILPVHQQRFIEGAWRRGADVIMLDLEDSVAPEAKQLARSLVRDAIPIVARGCAAVTVRVNAHSWRADTEASLWPGVSSITLPKAESAAVVRDLASLLDRLEVERGMGIGSTRIAPAIETVSGLLHAQEIAAASPRVLGVSGPAGVDFAADLGLEIDPRLDQLEPARGELDLLSRALGGRGSTPWITGQGITEYGEAERFERAAGRSQRYGGRGSAGIHPSVIEPFNRGYTPPFDDVTLARRVIEAVEGANAAGRGAAVVDGRFVTVHQAAAARDYLRFAEACAERDEEKRRCSEAALTEEAGGPS